MTDNNNLKVLNFKYINIFKVEIILFSEWKLQETSNKVY